MDDLQGEETRASAEGHHDSAEDIPGVGEQPPVPLGEDDREDRRGRRRRRGRRGGRRGRDRDGPRSEDSRAQDGNGAEQAPVDAASDGTADRHEAPREQAAPQPEEPAAEPAPEPQPSSRPNERQEPAVAAAADEQHWHGPVETKNVEREASRLPEPTPVAPDLPARGPMHAEHAQEDDDPSRPVRRGWWQRRFSGE